MTKPVRRIRARQTPDVDDWAGMPIEYWQPEPKPAHPLILWIKRVFSWSKKK